MIRVHGTTIAIEEHAVLMRAPPGGGKSDLALRLVDEGALLVADDQTELRLEDGGVFASAAEAIAGYMEIRGLGVVAVPAIARARLALVVDLVPPGRVERLPESRFCMFFDRKFPLLLLAPFEASAAAKLRTALRLLARTGRLESEETA